MANEEIKKALRDSGLRFSTAQRDTAIIIPCAQGCENGCLYGCVHTGCDQVACVLSHCESGTCQYSQCQTSGCGSGTCDQGCRTWLQIIGGGNLEGGGGTGSA